jgi:hypothetical protein
MVKRENLKIPQELERKVVPEFIANPYTNSRMIKQIKKSIRDSINYVQSIIYSAEEYLNSIGFYFV